MEGIEKMIYKNAEIHNASDLEINKKDGSMTWYRMPKHLMDKFEAPNGQAMNISSTGVEIRFVIKSGEAVVRMQSISEESVNTCFHIYRDGIQGGYLEHELNTHVPTAPSAFTFSEPENIDTLRAMANASGDLFAPEVVRVIFDRGAYRILDIAGNIAPPSKAQVPAKTLLCYGSSITHGSNSIDASHTWASLTAHELNMDLRNLGMAGSGYMEPEVIDYIAAEGERGMWDAAIMELGINVLFWDESKIRERTKNAVEQIAGRNADKKVYVISPLYCGDDYYGNPSPGNWRRIIKETVDSLAFKNVTHINGLELLDNMTLLSVDEVHPSIYGVQQIADRLIHILKNW